MNDRNIALIIFFAVIAAIVAVGVGVFTAASTLACVFVGLIVLAAELAYALTN